MSTPQGHFPRSASTSFFLKPLKLDSEEVPNGFPTTTALFKSQSSPQNSPSHKTSQRLLKQASSYLPSPTKEKSDFLFVNKKKVVDFLMTDSLIKHSKLTRENSATHKLKLALLPPVGSGTNSSTPGLSSPSSRPETGIGSPLGSPGNAASGFKKAFEATVAAAGMKKTGETPQTSGNPVDKVLKLISPLNPKNLYLQEINTSDKTTNLIRHHKHRIYGRDHLNLQKLNAMLGKQDGPKSVKPKSMVQTPSINMHRIDLSKILEHKGEEENMLKNCSAYEYNPVTDSYQFKEANVKDLDTVLISLTTPKEYSTCRVIGSMGLTDRTKRKSQFIAESTRNLTTHGNIPLSINLETNLTKQTEPSYNQTAQKFKRSSIMELSKITQGSHFFAINSDRFGKKTDSKKFIEESAEEQSKRIIAQTYRHFNEGSQSKISFRAGEDKMKKIEEICGKMESQSKRMLKKFKKNKKKLQKDYRSLDKRVHSVIDSKFKDVVITTTTHII